MTSEPGKRCIIYLRVSDAGATDAYGMDSQRRECLAYAAERGWAVVAVHEEWHTGAELFERPELTKIRAAMKQDAFDVLLVHRMDRLSRDVNHQGYILSEAKHHGIAWDSATEDLDDSPLGGILRAVVGAFAEMDRLKIAANTMRGKHEKVSQGRPLGAGKPPYGLLYREADEILPGGKVVSRTVGYAEDPTTIGHLRRIFRDADAGLSLRGISRGLATDGILPPYHSRTGATRWAMCTLRTILMNRIYLGEVAAFRHVTYKTTAADGSLRKTRRHRERPTTEQVLLPAGAAPVVIEPALFARVQVRLEQNRARATDFRQTRNPEVGILRRGLAFCANCGARLVVLCDGSAPTYRCSGRERTGCRARGAIRVDHLDPAIWGWLTAVLADEARVRWHLDELQQTDPTADDLAALKRQRQDVERQRAKFVAVIERMEDPEAAGPIAAKLDGLSKQLRGIDRDEEAILARQAAWRQAQVEAEDVLATCRRIAHDMAHVTEWADQRAFAQLLKIRVDVAQGGRWAARSEIVSDVVTGGGSNLYRTSESSTRNSTTSSCSPHPPR